MPTQKAKIIKHQIYQHHTICTFCKYTLSCFANLNPFHNISPSDLQETSFSLAFVFLQLTSLNSHHLIYYFAMNFRTIYLKTFHLCYVTQNLSPPMEETHYLSHLMCHKYEHTNLQACN